MYKEAKEKVQAHPSDNISHPAKVDTDESVSATKQQVPDEPIVMSKVSGRAENAPTDVTHTIDNSNKESETNSEDDPNQPSLAAVQEDEIKPTVHRVTASMPLNLLFDSDEDAHVDSNEKSTSANIQPNHTSDNVCVDDTPTATEPEHKVIIQPNENASEPAKDSHLPQDNQIDPPKSNRVTSKTVEPVVPQQVNIDHNNTTEAKEEMTENTNIQSEIHKNEESNYVTHEPDRKQKEPIGPNDIPSSNASNTTPISAGTTQEKTEMSSETNVGTTRSEKETSPTSVSETATTPTISSAKVATATTIAANAPETQAVPEATVTKSATVEPAPAKEEPQANTISKHEVQHKPESTAAIATVPASNSNDAVDTPISIPTQATEATVVKPTVEHTSNAKQEIHPVPTSSPAEIVPETTAAIATAQASANDAVDAPTTMPTKAPETTHVTVEPQSTTVVVGTTAISSPSEADTESKEEPAQTVAHDDDKIVTAAIAATAATAATAAAVSATADATAHAPPVAPDEHKTTTLSPSTHPADAKAIAAATIASNRAKKRLQYRMASQTSIQSVDKVTGRIQIKLLHEKVTENLVITVYGAEDLYPCDHKVYRNAYAKIFMYPEVNEFGKRRTRTCERQLNPIWNQTFMYFSISDKRLDNSTMQVTVWDNDKEHGIKFLGEAVIKMATAKLDNQPHWHLLRNHDHSVGQLPPPTPIKKNAPDKISSHGLRRPSAVQLHHNEDHDDSVGAISEDSVVGHPEEVYHSSVNANKYRVADSSNYAEHAMSNSSHETTVSQPVHSESNNVKDENQENNHDEKKTPPKKPPRVDRPPSEIEKSPVIEDQTPGGINHNNIDHSNHIGSPSTSKSYS